MKLCAVLMSIMVGSAICACSDDDAPPPDRDAGYEPDGAPADGAPADGPGRDASPADGAPADGPGADGSGDHTPPTITATDPADGAAGVEPGLSITVSFDEPVTVGEPADGLALLDEAGQPVPGTVEVDGSVLRFVPLDDLALLGSYTAVVTPAVTDLAGNPLASEHRFQLSVRDGAWETTATPIDAGNNSAQSPDVAMDPRGNVIAVWRQYSYPSMSIWANHYDARTGQWSGPQVIGHFDFTDSRVPRVAMDAAGNAVAVWLQNDDQYDRVWASHYDTDTGWDAPVQLDVTNTGDAQPPRIAMNPGGEAVAVWRQLEAGASQAWLSRYVAGTGWSVAEPVQDFGQPIPTLDVEPEVGIDAEGTAVVLVHDENFNVLAVPHRVASGWGEPELLIRGPAEGFAMDMAPSGQGLAMWQFPQPSRIHVWRFDPGGASRLHVLMEREESEFGQLRFGDVGVNPAGDGVALWYQDSPPPAQLWLGTYSAAADDWSEPQGMLTDCDMGAVGGQVGIDPRDHAHAIWLVDQAGVRLGLMTSRRVAPGGFGAPLLFPGDISQAVLAVNAQGKAVILWSEQVEIGDSRTSDVKALFFR
jgi:hypothetical protein